LIVCTFRIAPNARALNGLLPSGEMDGTTILVLDIPVPGAAQGQQSSQAGYSTPQGRSTSQMDRSTRQMRQGDQRWVIDAYPPQQDRGGQQ
jgi:hypothetical protein